MEDWTQFLVIKPAPDIQILDWWEKDLVGLPKKTRKLKAALMIYAAWNIWKERNHRVFDQKVDSPPEVMQEIKREVTDRKMACGGLELPSLFNV
ncbi:hypothetical protein PAHAL_9G159700 [Panicum hallii]|jgi:hypothetical protein|uniref:Uncharacterized protein n=1 Tax=Panicum hallii TaxID=206008 RepID=A0A2S3IJY9_9POAL|nr:hypothetical protein PAHAL_9G159700 [Panicum hallii]